MNPMILFIDSITSLIFCDQDFGSVDSSRWLGCGRGSTSSNKCDPAPGNDRERFVWLRNSGSDSEFSTTTAMLLLKTCRSVESLLIQSQCQAHQRD